MSCYLFGQIIYSFLFTNGILKILLIMKSRFIVIICCLIFANMLNGQLQNSMQRKIYEKYGIKKIEKFLLSDTDSINDVFLMTENFVNPKGFIIKHQAYDLDGKTTLNEHIYLNDTILKESHLIQNLNRNSDKDIVKYTYNSKNNLESFSYFDRNQLITEVEYHYNENGQLKSQIEKFYANKTKGSYSGEVKKLFQYDSLGQISEIHQKTTINLKKERKNYKYRYFSNPKIVEQYLAKNTDEFQIVEREVFDEKNRLKVWEHFYSTGSIHRFNNRQIKVEKGKSLRYEYTYDDRGLVLFEKIGTEDGQEINIKYRYSD